MIGCSRDVLDRIIVTKTWYWDNPFNLNVNKICYTVLHIDIVHLPLQLRSVFGNYRLRKHVNSRARDCAARDLLLHTREISFSVTFVTWLCHVISEITPGHLITHRLDWNERCDAFTIDARLYRRWKCNNFQLCDRVRSVHTRLLEISVTACNTSRE